MLFKFLKHLQPTNYFSIKRHDASSLFPDANVLPQSILNKLKPDQRYNSTLAKEYDLSWQALHKGYIGDCKTINGFKALPLVDNYIFIRKYFNAAWAFYVLVIRLLSFNNPFKEIWAWLKTRAIKRSNYLETPIVYEQWDDFDSPLIKQQPKVSIVIPTLNRYEYLKDVLQDLEQQDYTNFEVIVIDQSEPFQKIFYNTFNLDIKVVHQKEKALWLARNKAIKQAEGDYLLLFDDDSRVDTNWISNHIKALDFFNADISSGVSISKIGAKIPKHYAFFKISDQLDTGNVLIKRTVFNTIGLFDRQFEKQRMGDGEFGLRAYLNGFRNVSNPYAKRLHLKVSTGGLRTFGAWDAFRPKHLLAPRPIPSVLYFYRSYFGKSATWKSILRTVPMSIMPYRFKAHKVLLLSGAILSVLVLPLIVFQVLRSWYLSSKMLKQGPIIDTLY